MFWLGAIVVGVIVAAGFWIYWRGFPGVKSDLQDAGAVAKKAEAAAQQTVNQVKDAVK